MPLLRWRIMSSGLFDLLSLKRSPRRGRCNCYKKRSLTISAVSHEALEEQFLTALLQERILVHPFSSQFRKRILFVFVFFFFEAGLKTPKREKRSKSRVMGSHVQPFQSQKIFLPAGNFLDSEGR